MYFPLRYALLVIWLLAAHSAAAVVYQCRDAAGGTVYQDEPCTQGTLIKTVDADPKTNVLPHTPEPARSQAPKPSSRKTAEPRPKKKAAPRTGNAAERPFLREGLEETEVLVKVGPPDLRSTGPAPSGRGKVKRWVYLPTEGDPATVTTVMLQQGKVVGIERRVSR